MNTIKQRSDYHYLATIILLSMLIYISSVSANADQANEIRPEVSAVNEPGVRLDKYEKVIVENYDNLLGLYVDLMKEFVKNRPSGSKNPRENFYGALTMVWFATLANQIALPAAGTTLGAGIGTVVGITETVATFGGGAVGAPVLAAGGGLLGAGAGIGIGAANMALSAIVTFPIVNMIEENYPPNESASLENEDAFASILNVLIPSAHAGSPYAGPWESLYIHLIDAAFSNKVLVLAQQWTTMSGLTLQQRETLKKVNFMQQIVKDIAFTKRNKKVARNSKVAAPLSGFYGDAIKLLKADNATLEKAWLAAFSVGSSRMRVNNGKVVYTTPQSLKLIGAQPTISLPVPHFDIKVPANANGDSINPYIKAKFSPGPFDMKLGNVELVKSGRDKGKIKVSFSVNRKQLATTNLKYKWYPMTRKGNGNREVNLQSGSVKLTQKAIGSIFFKVAGYGLTFDRLSLPSLNLQIVMPNTQKISTMPGINNILSEIEKEINLHVQNMIENFGYANLFAPLKTYSKKSLLAYLQDNSVSYKVDEIKSVQNLSVTAGKLVAKVIAKVYKGPKINDVTQVNRAIAKYKKQISAAAATGAPGRSRPLVNSASTMSLAPKNIRAQSKSKSNTRAKY